MPTWTGAADRRNVCRDRDMGTTDDESNTLPDTPDNAMPPPAPSASKVPSPARISGRQQQTTSGKVE